jgi:hypothetical protein
MNIEIPERIVKGNKACYATAKLIKLTFLKRNTKLKIYKTIINNKTSHYILIRDLDLNSKR